MWPNALHMSFRMDGRGHFWDSWEMIVVSQLEMKVAWIRQSCIYNHAWQTCLVDQTQSGWELWSAFISGVPVMDYHEPNVWKQQKFILSQFRRPEVWDQGFHWAILSESWRGGSVPCLSFGFWLFLETLCILDLWIGHSSPCLCHHKHSPGVSISVSSLLFLEGPQSYWIRGSAYSDMISS